MRRLCSLICCVLSLLLCASCLAEEPAFRVSVANLCEAELYGIHYEYALGGEPAGGGIICNASGGPIARGDTLTGSFTARNFPEGADLSSFSIQFFAVLQNDQEFPVGEPPAFSTQYGQTYEFSLTGEERTGFEIS